MFRRVVFLCALFAVLLIMTSLSMAQDLEEGMTASDFSFPDASGKMYSMEDWPGRVLVVNYVDPDESDLNDHFTDALKQAKKDGLLTDEKYKGIGIADCAATWKPNFAIRAIAGRKAKKYNTVILFDYDGELREEWGLEIDTANVIILDKNRVVQGIIRGRVPDDHVDDLVKFVSGLQEEQ